MSLLFHFLDEWLYKFSADEFFIPRVSVLASAFSFWRRKLFPDNPSSECSGKRNTKNTRAGWKVLGASWAGGRFSKQWEITFVSEIFWEFLPEGGRCD